MDLAAFFTNVMVFLSIKLIPWCPQTYWTKVNPLHFYDSFTFPSRKVEERKKNLFYSNLKWVLKDFREYAVVRDVD